jgi:ATP-binding cassette subfamily B (MDR/TAP) protein 1
MFIAAFTIGFTTSWVLSLVLCPMLPVLFFGGWLMSKVLQEGTKRNRGAFEKAGGIAEEVIYNIKTVASFANFDWEKKRFYDKLEESYQAGKKNALKGGIGNGIIFIAIFGTYCLAIWYGSVLISGEAYNPNTKAKFQAGDVLTCLFSIVFGAFSLGQASPSIKAIFELVELQLISMSLRREYLR